MEMLKNKKGLLVVLIAAILIFIFIIFLKNRNGVESVPTRMSLTGEYVGCLPRKNNVSTDGCISGIKTGDGSYYAIDFNLMPQMAEEFEPGERFSANGIMTPVNMLSSERMKGVTGRGIFSVTDSLEKL